MKLEKRSRGKYSPERTDPVRDEGTDHRTSVSGNAPEEPEEEMPLIRETIVRKFFWKEAVFAVITGILIAGVLGISVGIGVSYVAPLLMERHENSKDLDRLFGEAPTSTPTPTPPPETYSEPESDPGYEPAHESRDPYGSEPEDPTGSEEYPTDPTDITDPTEEGTGEETGKMSKEELNKLVEDYLKDPSHRADQVQLISEMMQDEAKVLNRHFVSIRVTRQNTDRWFESPLAASQMISSLVIEQTDDHMLMITDYKSISQANSLTVTIGQKELPVKVVAYDLITLIALVRVDITADVNKSFYQQITPVTFGSSATISVGELVLTAGSPTGYPGSFAYGYVTYMGEITGRWDAHYTVIHTDITSSEVPLGFLFDLDGRVVGYIDKASFGNSGMGSISALGIERLMSLVSVMKQNRNHPYVGIIGDDITEAMSQSQGIPRGIYINQTAQDSPAYLSAIQAGDIITAIDGRPCLTMEQLMDQLNGRNPNDVVRVTYRRWSTGGDYQEMNTDLILSGRFVFPEQSV